MSRTLFLTGDEQAVFAALPSALREGWAVEPETSESYETDQQLEVRRHLLEGRKEFMALNRKLEKLGKDEAETQDLLSDLPDGTVLPMVFALGARALTAYVAATLKDLRAEDLEGLALLTDLRHQLFLANS